MIGLRYSLTAACIFVMFASGPSYGAETYRLTCLAPVGGVLSEPQDFVLADGILTLNGRRISAETEMEIGRTTSDAGPSVSTAVHHWLVVGETLERTVYWNEPKGRKKAFVEIYDFKHQRLLEDGKDGCHHDRRVKS